MKTLRMMTAACVLWVAGGAAGAQAPATEAVPAPTPWPDQAYHAAYLCPDSSLARAMPFAFTVPCNLWAPDYLYNLAHGLKPGPDGMAFVEVLHVTTDGRAVEPDAALARFARRDYRCFVTAALGPGQEIAPGTPYEWAVRPLSLADLARSPCEAVRGPWQHRVVAHPVLLRLVGVMMAELRTIAGELILLADEEARLTGIFGRPAPRRMVENPNLAFADEVQRLSDLALVVTGAARNYFAAIEPAFTAAPGGDPARDVRVMEAWFDATFPSYDEWATLGLEERVTLLAALLERPFEGVATE